MKHAQLEPTSPAQAPDRTPGHYYVSIVRDRRVGLLAGPFVNDHAAALAMVERAKELAVTVDPWAAFDAFGTVKVSPTFGKPGSLNAKLGLA